MVATAQGEFSFSAKSYTELDGSRAGSVTVDSFASMFVFVTRTGAEFANAVTVNSNGAVTINATLDLFTGRATSSRSTNRTKTR